MSQGVPGIPPPKALLDALAQAGADPGSCGYVPNAGEPTLRRAIVEEMKESYGHEADLTEEDISITAGCNLAFVSAITTVAAHGDEVILPVPWYFNHEYVLRVCDFALLTKIQNDLDYAWNQTRLVANFAR